MRGFVGKYEASVRLGLVFIVVLLLLLNISTAYILYDVKDKLTADVNRSLDDGLGYARQYLTKNQMSELNNDQRQSIIQRFGITEIKTSIVTSSDADSLTSQINSELAGNTKIPILAADDLEHLLGGRNLYCSGSPGGIRYGLTLARIAPGRRLLLLARADSEIMNIIGKAARMGLYLGGGIILLILPVMISLPRLILRPFKRMRQKAQSAGKLIQSQDSDEVAEVIKSYENIIDELKRNEADLEQLYRESSTKADRLEKLNRYILKSIGSGVINVDLTGKVIGYNRAAMNILGYDAELVLGKHYLVAFPQEMELALLIGAGLERGETVSRREMELKRPEQPDIWLGVESSIIINDKDRVVGVTLLVTDLTELKKLHGELEVNRRLAALGEMTGGLAHQLRNSLAAISGFCQLLQKKTGGSTDLGDIAGSIRSEAAASETMVSRFLNFSKPLSLMEETVDLGNLLNDCVGKFTSEAAARDCDLKVNLPQETLTLTGDALLLKEALCNIIGNAIEAADIQGQVSIEADRSNSYLNIIISDNGPGIAESIKGKLFTPFVSSKPSGTGLGLAMARKIINLHKGTISLESVRREGTVCRIALPEKVSDSDFNKVISNEGVKKQ
jgi:PAS domain S-box-containing protein